MFGDGSPVTTSSLPSSLYRIYPPICLVIKAYPVWNNSPLSFPITFSNPLRGGQKPSSGNEQLFTKKLFSESSQRDHQGRPSR